MNTSVGELAVLGINLRPYDAKKKTWNIKWLNSLDGSSVDLGMPELGGVKNDEEGITHR